MDEITHHPPTQQETKKDSPLQMADFLPFIHLHLQLTTEQFRVQSNDVTCRSKTEVMKKTVEKKKNKL
jgi:hypothetical protein